MRGFLSTLSLRRATWSDTSYNLLDIISIHALLAESDPETGHKQILLPGISIHALLAESDGVARLAHAAHLYFYPRSPCGERRLWVYDRERYKDFYPRSPCGERPIPPPPRRSAWHFYPRSPCGERPTDAVNGCNPDFISIHALLAESDAPNRRPCPRSKISIHALLAESDVSFMLYDTSSLIFLSTLSLRRATMGCIL